MKLSLVTSQNIAELNTECLVVGLFKDGTLTPSATTLDQASNGSVKSWIESGDISGDLGCSTLFPSFPGVVAKRVLFIGLGKKTNCRKNFAKVIQSVVGKTRNIKNVTLTALEWMETDQPEWMVQTVAQTSITTCSSVKNYKTQPSDGKKTESIHLVVEKKTKALTSALTKGSAIAKSVELAKELGDMPGNICTPKYLAEVAQKLGKVKGFDVTVYEEKAIRKLKMGGLLGVASGSINPPCVVIMEYRGGQKGEKPVALVGKGLTFDAGGISLKPAASMDEMKYDMSGAGSVIASMVAIASLKLPINVVAIVGCTENLPSGSAVKPGDILTTYSGKTVEVLNTDAEGRLVLVDLLSFIIDQFKPTEVIDTATLTGACVIALGNEISGLFCTDEKMASELLEAGEKALDSAWRMPLNAQFTQMLESRFADLANIGGRAGGACTAAAFLKEFVGDTPWAHLDIAGTAWKSGKEKGSTGRPVPLLVNYLINKIN